MQLNRLRVVAIVSRIREAKMMFNGGETILKAD